jgi:hypothetical protein
MKIPFIFVLLFYVSLSFSQIVRVCDEDDKKPIPYVTAILAIQNRIVGGDYCDSIGFIKIDDKILFDKIELSCIGYENKILDKITLNQDTLFLKKKTINLNEVIISNKNVQLLGYTNLKKSQTPALGKGIETVVFIENIVDKPLHIKSFLFKLREAKKKATIRIHFYKLLPDKFEPGEEISTTDIIHSIDEKTKELVEIDVAQYGLYLPIEGGFVGIESLGILDEKTENIEDHFGFEFNSKLDKSITFSRNRFKVKIWDDINARIKRFKPNFKTMNASFGIKVFNE